MSDSIRHIRDSDWYWVIRSFAATVYRIFAGALSHKFPMVTSIFVLDLFSAISRIVVVLIIALAVKVLSGDSSQSYFGINFEFSNSFETILIFGIAIGVISVIGAMAGFNSIRLSRKLGRWSNSLAMNDLYSVLALHPSVAAGVKIQPPGNVNLMLTQFPMHAGLATETLARMINPVLLFLFSILVLFVQQPIFAFVTLLLGMLFVPLFLRTGRRIQSNARAFYSKHALELGAGVSSLANLMNSQHGIANKQTEAGSLAGLDFVNRFFDSYDMNMLANERAGLIVSLADALLRPVLFVVLVSMVFLGELTVEATIAFLGSLTYLFMSAKSVSGLFINLLRFHPQVQQYHKLLDAASSQNLTPDAKPLGFPSSLKVRQLTDNSNSFTMKPGHIGLGLIDNRVSTLNLGRLLPAIIGDDAQNQNLLNNLYFVSSSFRFAKTTIIEQLCTSGYDVDREKIAIQHCVDLGAADCIQKLPRGYQTELSEDVWNKLNAASRVALRIVPLMMWPQPNLIMIDVGVISGLGEKIIPVLKKSLQKSYIFLLLENGSNCPQYEVENYFSLVNWELTGIGKQGWFINEVASSGSGQSKEGELSNLDLIM